MNEIEWNPDQPFSEVGNSYYRNSKRKYLINSIIGIALMISLYVMSYNNYSLFHSITDMIIVLIAASVFIIIWIGRHRLDNHFYLFIGIAFLFYALFNFLHLIGNKGMGVFPEFGNLGPTFYIISRYILSISFLLAPIFLKKKLNVILVFIIYALVSTVFLLSIFYWQNFPVSYIEGVGLTRFKIISDYVAAVLLIGAVGLLLHNRSSFDARVLRLILFSLIGSIITGIAFTLYSDPFGIINAMGHFLQIAAFYLVFLAFVDTGLAKPQDLLYRNLKQSNMAILQLNTELAKVNSDLIDKIAELKKKDLALKESEAQANSLIKYAPTAIFEFDIKMMRFSSVNEAMCRMCGYSREELYDLNPMSLLSEDDSQVLLDSIKLQRAGEATQEAIECKVRKKDGSTIYVALKFSFVDDSSETVFVIGHDITARRIYEDQLRESEERFRTLSDTSPVGVKVTSYEGVIIYANHTFEALLGYDHAWLIGSKETDLYWVPEDRNNWINQLKNNGFIRNIELRLKRKDGMPVWVLVNASLISYGGTPAIMETMQDISDRKTADEELKRYAAELEVSNKELETFAYALSHDLRAPLRVMDGFSQVILDDYGDNLDATGSEYLSRIRGAAQSMAQIIDDMLKLSKVIRNDLSWETVNLSDMASAIVKGLSEQEPERKTAIKIAPDIIARGDPSLLHIALFNLIENAWKFSADSPQVEIEFSKVQQDDSVIYFIKDNGIGFDMQYADKLFMPFQRFQTKTDYPGHGIGLATVQRVISRHVGKIWAESEQGKGTTFYFTLGNYGKES